MISDLDMIPGFDGGTLQLHLLVLNKTREVMPLVGEDPISLEFGDDSHPKMFKRISASALRKECRIHQASADDLRQILAFIEQRIEEIRARTTTTP